MTNDEQNINKIELLTGASLLFGLLGKLVHTYPAKEWLEELLPQNVFEEIPFATDHPEVRQGLALLQAWNQDALARPIEEVVRELGQDHLELFVGMGELVAPPWESVYMTPDKLVFQEPTIQVRAFYRRFGLQVDKLGKEPDDHIGTELEFLGTLSERAADALEAGNSSEFDELIRAQQEFLEQHLLKWAPKWCQDVIGRANTGFYKGMAMIIEVALEEAKLAMKGMLG